MVYVQSRNFSLLTFVCQGVSILKSKPSFVLQPSIRSLFQSIFGRPFGRSFFDTAGYKSLSYYDQVDL